MGIDWDRQPRDRRTGKWYSNDPRWWQLHMLLSTDEREALEDMAEELDTTMTDVVCQALKLLREKISDALEEERQAVKDAAAAAPASSPEAGHAP